VAQARCDSSLHFRHQEEGKKKNGIKTEREQQLTPRRHSRTHVNKAISEMVKTINFKEILFQQSEVLDF